MMYTGLIILSIVACFVGFNAEVASSNIIHMENGRKPNAGAAIFPDIPFIPLLFSGIAWLINKNPYIPNLGFFLTYGLLVVIIINSYFATKKLLAKLDEMKKIQEANENAARDASHP